uniref:uncharacterized protein LOC118530131 n=1 Tax=Halichoerus grypus TaxID=9711 RepID=UPI001658D64B|nr:uncharacterized protein LOC118530131 [Halichoerus grypus]
MFESYSRTDSAFLTRCPCVQTGASPETVQHLERPPAGVFTSTSAPQGVFATVLSEPDGVLLSAKLCPRSVQGSPCRAHPCSPCDSAPPPAQKILLSHWCSAIWVTCGFIGFCDLCIYHFRQIRIFGHDFLVFFLPPSLAGTWRTVCQAPCPTSLCASVQKAPAPPLTLLSLHPLVAPVLTCPFQLSMCVWFFFTVFIFLLFVMTSSCKSLTLFIVAVLTFLSTSFRFSPASDSVLVSLSPSQLWFTRLQILTGHRPPWAVGEGVDTVSFSVLNSSLPSSSPTHESVSSCRAGLTQAWASQGLCCVPGFPLGLHPHPVGASTCL